MSFLSENVIPGNYGKKFTTDAKHPNDLTKIQESLMQLEGIKDVLFESESKPIVFVIHTNKVISVKDIEDCIRDLNLHAIPTGPFFPLA